jgi:GT2 family glycosyltransferase
MTLLTVGLPVYNAMPFLPQTVDSLLGQSYEDFQLLVIDDGSTDGSLEYMRSVKDRRLRVVSQEHHGLSGTLNRMLREVITPWMVRHDADDIAFPQRLAITANYIERFPDAGMFYSYARYYQDGRIFGTFRSTTATPEGLRHLTRSGLLLAICHPTATLNVEKAIAAGGYRFNLHVEDIDLWWRMALAYDIRLIPEATLAVRHNLASVSAQNFERQCINTLFIQYLLLSHLWQMTPLPYETVYSRLSVLVDRRQIRFRENTRLTSICLSRKRHAEALKHACSAFMASPLHLLTRVLYELRPKAPVTNGTAAERFREQRDLLWPQERHIPAAIPDATKSAGQA